MDTSKFRVEKGTVEIYKIRHPSGCYWADITLDIGGRGGRISIASDYGNWSNYWGAAGDDFKAFLGKIAYDYAEGKFDAKRWIDVDATVKSFRKTILELRREETIDRDDARGAWDELKEIEGESSQHFNEAVNGTDYLKEIFYRHTDYVDYEYKDNPHFRDFWRFVWPVLLAEFAREKEQIEVTG